MEILATIGIIVTIAVGMTGIAGVLWRIGKSIRDRDIQNAIYEARRNDQLEALLKEIKYLREEQTDHAHRLSHIEGKLDIDHSHD